MLYVIFQSPILESNGSLDLYNRLTAFPTSMISDEYWNRILAKENDLLSAVIKANTSQYVHQIKRKALERIACEIEGYNIAMQYPRKVFDGLLSEFCQLRWGQRANAGDDDHPSVNAINAMPNESHFPNTTGSCTGMGLL